MIFACQACGATLEKKDIDFNTGVACCSQCEAVMSFAEEMGLNHPVAPAPSATQEAPPLPKIAKPKRIRVEESPAGLRIIRPWFDGTIIFLTFFCLFWDGGLAMWYADGLKTEQGTIKLVMLLFPLIHVAVGVCLTYYTICGYFNQTTIEVNEAYLRIHNGPLPWRGNQSLSASDISQLCCDEKRGDDDGSSFYSLHAILKNGDKQALVTNLTDHDLVLYLEQQIEQRLGIHDKPVSYEFV